MTISPYRAIAVHSPIPVTWARWGQRMTAIGDVDGDGVGDVLVGTPPAGRAYVLSGVELAKGRAVPIHVVEAPEGFARNGFGIALTALGDVDGDGVGDFAVGTAEADRVWVVSGATGQVITTITSPLSPLAVEPRFGSRLGSAGDIDGDGAAELLVGAPGASGGDGEAFIFYARTGELLRSLRLPEEDRRASGVAGFGMSVQGPGDIDGNGVPDQLVSAPSWDDARGRMYAFSGATGELLMALDSPDPQAGARFGFQDVAPASPGDVNGDGCAALYGTAFQHHGAAGRDEGRAWVLDGRTGKTLYSLADPVPIAGGQFGWSMARTDHDGVGRSDLYVGAAPHHFPGSDQSGGTWVFRGGDGALLETLSLPEEWDHPSSAENWGPNLGWSIAAPGDLDGDGGPDYVAGAPFADVDGHQDQGLLVVFLSGG